MKWSRPLESQLHEIYYMNYRFVKKVKKYFSVFKIMFFFSDILRLPIIYEDVGHYINFNMTLTASNLTNTEWEENFKKLIRRWKKVLYLQVKIQKKLNFDRTWRVSDLYILLEKITDEINCVRLDLQPINFKE